MAEITCDIALEDLGLVESCTPNMAGVRKIWFALRKDVLKVPTHKKVRTTPEDLCELSEGGGGPEFKDIVMKPGKRFYEFYSGTDLGELKYDVVGAEGGKGFNVNLEIFHPGLIKKFTGTFSHIKNRELLILCMLNNKDIHLLGDIDKGAVLADSNTITSGKASTDPIGGTLNFKYITPFMQYYVGTMDITVNEAS